MIRFSREKVLLLHKLITEETGGDPNLRDIGLLDSALESAFQTFGGDELRRSSRVDPGKRKHMKNGTGSLFRPVPLYVFPAFTPNSRQTP